MRAPFLADTLDDIDAVNFALAVEDFDPARHQPHPPGYAVYVVLAKTFASAAGAADDASARARALAWLSAIAQAALPLPLFVLFRRLGAEPRISAAATALTLLNPVVWMNGVRPMSDSLGLLFAVTTQALLLGASAGGRGALAGSALAGLAAGVRVQTLALTIPLWLWAMTRPGARRQGAAFALLVVAGLAWAVPTLIEAGGPSAYWHALRGTAGDAADVEPLVLTWTLNRAIRAARHVVFRPWGAEWLGMVMTALAGVGFIAGWRRGVALLPLLVAFGPYVVAHALFQQAHTQRYALPYIPALALLAVLGMETIARVAGRHAIAAFLGLAALGCGAAGAVALPGLMGYAAAGSPVYAALHAADKIRGSLPSPVLSGHYMFDRYLTFAPPGLAVARLPSRREMAALQASWTSGDERPRLFLAEPRRTDLATIDPAAQVARGEWAWPPATALLLSGERPGAVALVEIAAPSWFAGPGWGLSLEVARPDGIGEAVRTAHVRASPQASVLMLAGEPTDPAAGGWECELTLDGRALDRRPCGTPWLASYPVAPSDAKGYRPLVFRTSRGSADRAAPFALRGLAFGAAESPLLVHGDGWHYPETDEDGRPFRWATRAARTMANVPAGGARVVVEGLLPDRYVALPAAITLEAGVARTSVTSNGAFRLELDLPPGQGREMILRSDRDFVPDEAQRNGDRRRLAARIYRYVIARR